jgi:hypothetical protein
MKKHSSLFTLSLAIVAIVVVVLVGGQFVAHGQDTSASMSGWNWSSNIGWGSASSTQSGADGGGPYGLQVVNSGNITGYIWTSNIGWIKFGGLAGQSVGGMTTSDANVNITTGVVTGWARACGGTASGNCSSMASRTDGWDGWIELSGANHLSSSAGGGVFLSTSTKAFSGYAWGSDVVGWMDFSGIVLCSGGTCGTPPPTNTLSLTCSGNPSSLPSPGQVIFTATASGGTTPYYWNGSLTQGINSTSTTVSNYTGANGSAPTFTVHDSSPTPITGSISSCSIPVTTCPGGSCGGPTVSCSLSNPPSTTFSSSIGGSITVSSSNISNPSGGTGTGYKYRWSNGIGNWTASSSSPTATLSYPVNTPPNTYQPLVQVEDSSGTVSSPAICGSVTVTGINGGPSIPELWPGSSAKQSNYNFSNNPTLTTHAHPGDSVQVSYAWPNANSKNDCVGKTANTGLSNSLEWNNLDLGTTGSGSKTFTSVNLGIYTLGYTCTDSTDQAHPVITHSNPVEIDVTLSSVRER